MVLHDMSCHSLAEMLNTDFRSLLSSSIHSPPSSIVASSRHTILNETPVTRLVIPGSIARNTVLSGSNDTSIGVSLFLAVWLLAYQKSNEHPTPSVLMRKANPA